jgi:hypothetical protein
VELPEGRKALPSRQVYKIKHNGAGNAQRFKARRVCGGNHQIEGIDYQATYSPVTRLGHIRLALAIVAKYYLEIAEMDVCMASFGVDLEDEIYMHQPQGYLCLIQHGSRYNNSRLTKTSRKMILCLRKSLDGLKQFSHVWYGTVKYCVISIGFMASCVNRGLFVLHNQNQDIIPTVILHINYPHIIAIEGLIGRIMHQMNKMIRMHDLESVPIYPGLPIKLNREHHMIDNHQHSYIRTIFAKFRLAESWPVTTPMAMNLHKRKPDKEACDPTIYQSRI